MKKKERKWVHISKRSENPQMPEIKKMEMKPGDHVTLLVSERRAKDWGLQQIEKEFVFIKKYPHHYSFEDLNGFRESFTTQELREIMVR